MYLSVLKTCMRVFFRRSTIKVREAAGSLLRLSKARPRTMASTSSHPDQRRQRGCELGSGHQAAGPQCHDAFATVTLTPRLGLAKLCTAQMTNSPSARCALCANGGGLGGAIGPTDNSLLPSWLQGYAPPPLSLAI